MRCGQFSTAMVTAPTHPDGRDDCGLAGGNHVPSVRCSSPMSSLTSARSSAISVFSSVRRSAMSSFSSVRSSAISYQVGDVGLQFGAQFGDVGLMADWSSWLVA